MFTSQGELDGETVSERFGSQVESGSSSVSLLMPRRNSYNARAVENPFFCHRYQYLKTRA